MVKLSEEEDAIKKYNEEQVAEIPELIGKLEYGTESSNLKRIKELLSRFVLVDSFEKEIYLTQMKHRTGMGIGVLRRGLKEEEKNPNNPHRQDEDPFWLKIYNDINGKYGERIKAMSDSRQLMLKSGNIYTPDIKEFIEDLSKELDGYKTGYRNVRNDVLEKFRDSHLFDRNEFCYDPYIVNFKNGYYDIRNYPDGFVEIVESKDNKDKIFFYEIPYKFEPEFKEKPKKFLKALGQWLSKDNLIKPDDILEFMGYTMSMGVGRKKAFLIYGETNTGKTQFQEILKALIGLKNVSETSLHRMGEDKFGLQELEWKILNYFDDLSERALYDVSLFKVVAGGSSTLTIEEKGKKPYKVINVLKMWFNTNTVPPVKNIDDDSFFERWVIVLFKTQFTYQRKNRIDDFYREITGNEKEMQGIIHLCLEALKRLYDRKHFRAEINKDTAHMWNYLSDSSYAFKHEYLRDLEDGEYGIICSELVNIFNEYRNGKKGKKLPSMSTTTFNKMISKHGIGRWRPKDDEDRKVWRYQIDINDRCVEDRKIGFMQEKVKRSIEHYNEHPNSLFNGNGEPEPEPEKNGIFHWANWNDKEKFENRLKKGKVIKD